MKGEWTQKYCVSVCFSVYQVGKGTSIKQKSGYQMITAFECGAKKVWGIFSIAPLANRNFFQTPIILPRVLFRNVLRRMR